MKKMLYYTLIILGLFILFNFKIENKIIEFIVGIFGGACLFFGLDKFIQLSIKEYKN